MAHFGMQFDKLVTGCAFAIEDHQIIADWAKRHDHRALVRLDHGLEDEEYEEVVELRFGVTDRCRFIIWRTEQLVVVQPLLGRRRCYGSVNEALDGALLNKATTGCRAIRTPRYSAA